MSAPIRIAPARDQHRALILDSFWREYRSCPMAKGVPPGVLTRKLEALLDSPSWRALVATPDDDVDSVLGYLVYRDPFTLGWLHTLRNFRHKGVARALLSHAHVLPGHASCAFLPPGVAKVATEHGYTLRFRPYLPDIAADEAATRIAGLMDEGGT